MIFFLSHYFNISKFSLKERGKLAKQNWWIMFSKQNKSFDVAG